MSRLKPYRRPSPKLASVKRRDGYDWATLVLAFIGIVVAAATLVFSQVDQANSGQETANAVAGIERIANSMAAQQGAMAEQAEATRAAARSTAISARSIVAQTTAVRQSNVLAEQGLKVSSAGDAALLNEPISDFAVGAKFQAKITLLNTGHVALANVTVDAASKLLAKGAEPEVGSLPLTSSLVARLLATGGRTGQTLTGSVPLDQATIDLMKTGAVVLAVVGKATFRDANGLHHRYSCSLFSGEGAANGRGCVIGQDD